MLTHISIVLKSDYILTLLNHIIFKLILIFLDFISRSLIKLKEISQSLIIFYDTLLNICICFKFNNDMKRLVNNLI